MEGITIDWVESGGVSVVATEHWLEGTELVKVSVALSDAGFRASPLGGDRKRAERFVRSVLEADIKQVQEGGGGSPSELNYHEDPQEGATQWRRDLPDSDPAMWRELVNLHAPE